LTLNNQSNQQSNKEIQQLSKTLLENGFTNSDIEANHDLLGQALREAESGTWQVPLPDTIYSPIQGGFVEKQAYEADGVHRRYRTVSDPVELFSILKRGRDDQRRGQERICFFHIMLFRTV
jgi:hypothetical protein